MKNKYFGVVEGFYHKPYTLNQREDLIKFLSDINLNIFVYGPKSDPFHREKWYEPYPNNKLKEFERLNGLCKKYEIMFNYALAPMANPHTEKIIEKIKSMTEIGIEHFSLFYDDIKVPLNKETAEMQIDTANRLFEFLSTNIENPTLFFCPTQYRGFDKTEYILTLTKTLDKNIQIFWTGKKVVSNKITEKDIDNITRIINRSPLIWDNIFANDYIPGIILKFPYRNREPEIIEKTSGVLINPMNQYKQSKPLIYTAAKFFKDPYNYNPRKAWQEAMIKLKNT